MHIPEEQAHADRAPLLKVASDDAIQSQRSREGGAHMASKKKTLKNTNTPGL